MLDGVSTTDLNEMGLTRLRREKVGFIFQSFQLLNTLSVIENVELPLLLAGQTDTRERALEQLELVELAELQSRMPSSTLRWTDATCRHRPRDGARPKAVAGR